MKNVKGFGKNYFRLSAIQAQVNKMILDAKEVSISAKAIFFPENVDDICDDPPDLDILLTESLNLPVAKRCNCIFNQKCRLTLKNCKLRGKPKCNCKHLNHRKTGIAPPSLSL